MDNYTSLDKSDILNRYIDRKRHLEEKSKTNDKLPKIENKSHEILHNTPRKRKTWEQWSSEETNLFFDALAMHGKNFEHIWNFMSSKRGSQMTRNKEQIRHFYYRTWAKISKYIKYNDVQTSLKKPYIELICLLSYGELRRRFPQFDEKKFRKILKEHLSNLVFTGSSWAKFKDRKIKIKLPSCEAIKNIIVSESNAVAENHVVQASAINVMNSTLPTSFESHCPPNNPVVDKLHKINDLASLVGGDNKGVAGLLTGHHDNSLLNVIPKTHYKVPNFLDIYLVPKAPNDWTYVQSLSHNPRVKLKVHPSSKVLDITLALKKRWDTSDYQKYLSKYQNLIRDNPQTMDSCRLNEDESLKNVVSQLGQYESSLSIKLEVSNYHASTLNQVPLPGTVPHEKSKTQNLELSFKDLSKMTISRLYVSLKGPAKIYLNYSIQQVSMKNEINHEYALNFEDGKKRLYKNLFFLALNEMKVIPANNTVVQQSHAALNPILDNTRIDYHDLPPSFTTTTKNTPQNSTTTILSTTTTMNVSSSARSFDLIDSSSPRTIKYTVTKPFALYSPPPPAPSTPNSLHNLEYFNLEQPQPAANFQPSAVVGGIGTLTNSNLPYNSDKPQSNIALSLINLRNYKSITAASSSSKVQSKTPVFVIAGTSGTGNTILSDTSSPSVSAPLSKIVYLENSRKSFWGSQENGANGGVQAASFLSNPAPAFSHNSQFMAPQQQQLIRPPFCQQLVPIRAPRRYRARLKRPAMNYYCNLQPIAPKMLPPSYHITTTTTCAGIPLPFQPRHAPVVVGVTSQLTSTTTNISQIVLNSSSQYLRGNNTTTSYFSSNQTKINTLDDSLANMITLGPGNYRIHHLPPSSSSQIISKSNQQAVDSVNKILYEKSGPLPCLVSNGSDIYHNLLTKFPENDNNVVNISSLLDISLPASLLDEVACKNSTEHLHQAAQDIERCCNEDNLLMNTNDFLIHEENSIFQGYLTNHCPLLEETSNQHQTSLMNPFDNTSRYVPSHSMENDFPNQHLFTALSLNNDNSLLNNLCEHSNMSFANFFDNSILTINTPVTSGPVLIDPPPHSKLINDPAAAESEPSKKSPSFKGLII